MTARPHAQAARSTAGEEPTLKPERPSSPMELRVLGGPQAGATIAWPETGRALVLAAGDDGAAQDGASPHGGAWSAPGEPVDLQLLGDVPVRLRLRALAHGAARCEVLAGEVAMAGEPHAAGARFEWPRQVPLQLGASLAIAFGDADVPMWSLVPLEASSIGGADDRDRRDDRDPRDGDERDGADDMASAATTPTPGRLEAILAGGGAVLGVAGLVWSLLITLPTAPQAAVHATPTPSPVAITAQKPQDLLPPPPEAPSAPTPVAAAKPVPAEPTVPTLPAAGNEPGKRIVTLVSQGALPHLVTADGGRYFVGATLPSGHRLAAVLPQGLVLERDGRETRIDF